MNIFSLRFDFDELVIPILGRNDNGLLLYGSAELSGDHEGFSVEAIYLAQGTMLRPAGNAESGRPAPFADELFRRIADVIGNDKTVLGRHAAMEWAELVERHGEAA
ncbi:hypothetical protein [Rhizobium sp. WYJ-E13]|uniref:hypothetical protein n=1 Tax=Rhizobium sp. WYJ-E13 TaxID=2849093 RepID=UPI001C1F0659|nr:hypothetical protein [Rhizobium sp. WYJ-E13]QWW69866.1 hypothetical protein KQ933_09280 [Rhizobium sp. WYJ-E13]